MDLSVLCACGTELELSDISPATAELFLDRFAAEHPHDSARALSAMTPILSGEGHSAHDDDDDDA